MTKSTYIRYEPVKYSIEEMLYRSFSFRQWLATRRSVRDFSDETVPEEILENIIRAAVTSPSGANKQPWTFCVVSNPQLKKEIRIAAEKEEYESYHGRMSEEWINDLAVLGTDWHKPFLETAPFLIVVFKRIYELTNNSEKKSNYYVQESVGIACGLMIAAIHHAGLITLTHTPSPMQFLSKILHRPENERAFLLLPVGYPAVNAEVPNIARKPFEEVCVWYK